MNFLQVPPVWPPRDFPATQGATTLPSGSGSGSQPWGLFLGHPSSPREEVAGPYICFCAPCSILFTCWLIPYCYSDPPLHLRFIVLGVPVNILVWVLSPSGTLTDASGLVDRQNTLRCGGAGGGVFGDFENLVVFNLPQGWGRGQRKWFVSEEQVQVLGPPPNSYVTLGLSSPTP